MIKLLAFLGIQGLVADPKCTHPSKQVKSTDPNFMYYAFKAAERCNLSGYSMTKCISPLKVKMKPVTSMKRKKNQSSAFLTPNSGSEYYTPTDDFSSVNVKRRVSRRFR